MRLEEREQEGRWSCNVKQKKKKTKKLEGWPKSNSVLKAKARMAT